MRKIVLVLTIICMFLYTPLYAYRISKPLRITDYDQNGLVSINNNFEGLWNITNGRFNLNYTNVNPDGNLKGELGDMIIFNNSGTYYLEINVGGTIWRGVELQNVP